VSSIRLQIAQEVVILLNAVAKPVSVPESRLRRPIPSGPIGGPEINVYLAAEDVEVKGGRHGPLYQRRMRLVVECRNVTSDPTEVDTILDPLLVWVSKAINDSDNINRRAIDVVEGSTSWFTFYQERIYPIASMNFIIDYQTARKDSEANS
jgi:hypothetical protein